MAMKFSERKGLVQVSELIQIDGMNAELRNSIWNVLHHRLWSKKGFLDWDGRYEPRIRVFSRALWADYFKKPSDTRPKLDGGILAEIRRYFFGCEWRQVYDFIEFVCQFRGQPSQLLEDLNFVLERELSAYRVIDNVVVDITDEQEVKMLDEALKDSKYSVVSGHLKRALELLSDRNAPDFRNSIKESISAVESIAKLIVGNEKASFSEALAVLETRKKLHPALKQGFTKLYGYTSDENGIRHAMLEESVLTAADAKFFLLSCTSFVNYLKAQNS